MEVSVVGSNNEATKRFVKFSKFNLAFVTLLAIVLTGFQLYLVVTKILKLK